MADAAAQAALQVTVEPADFDVRHAKHNKKLEPGICDVSLPGMDTSGRLSNQLLDGEMIITAVDAYLIGRRYKKWQVILYSILTLGLFLLHYYCQCCKTKRGYHKKGTIAVTTHGRLLFWETEGEGEQSPPCLCIKGMRHFINFSTLKWFSLKDLNHMQHTYESYPDCLCFCQRQTAEIRLYFGEFPTHVDSDGFGVSAYNPTTDHYHLVSKLKAGFDVKPAASFGEMMLGPLMHLLTCFGICNPDSGHKVGQQDLVGASRDRSMILELSRGAKLADLVAFEKAVLEFKVKAEKPQAVSTPQPFFEMCNNEKTPLIDWRAVSAAPDNVVGAAFRGAALPQQKPGVYCVNVNHAEMALALEMGEYVVDAAPIARRIRILDYILMFITLGGWYCFHLRWVLRKQGAIVLTNVRVVELYKEIGDLNFQQSMKSWIIKDVGPFYLFKGKKFLNASFQTEHGMIEISPLLFNAAGKVDDWVRERMATFLMAPVQKYEPEGTLRLNFPPVQISKEELAKDLWPVKPTDQEMVLATHKGKIYHGMFAGCKRTLTCGWSPRDIAQHTFVTNTRIVNVSFIQGNCLLPWMNDQQKHVFILPLKHFQGYTMDGVAMIAEDCYTRMCPGICKPYTATMDLKFACLDSFPVSISSYDRNETGGLLEDPNLQHFQKVMGMIQTNLQAKDMIQVVVTNPQDAMVQQVPMVVVATQH